MISRLATLAMLICAVGIAGGWSASGQSGPPGAAEYEESRALMGTGFRIIVRTEAPESQARAAMGRALDRVASLESVFSDFDPESEVSRLVRSGGGQVSGELLELLTLSRTLYTATEGAFDVTQGHVTRLWRRAVRRQELPDDRALDDARRRTGWQFVRISGQSVALSGEVRLDFGGIAKGFAADEALRLLAEEGFPAALVDAGGDLRIGDGLWRVRVPGGGIRELTASAVATSGAAWRQVRAGAASNSHIVDPASGKGVGHNALTTVIAPSAAEADALATAFSVLDPVSASRIAVELGVQLIIHSDS